MSSDWDCSLPLHELVEAMDDKRSLIQIERMKRRYVDEKTKKSKFKLTDLIIVTYEGNVLPDHITLFDGIIRSRVRAFMEPVRQCFGCFAYGHFRKTCRAIRKCMVCGKDYHGECKEKPTCINCGESHIAIDKKRCILYEYNLNLKKTMTDRNMSIYEARKIVKTRFKKRYRVEKRASAREEDIRKKRNYYSSRGLDSSRQDPGHSSRRSYAEVVRGNESSEEERSEEKLKKKRSRMEKRRNKSDDRENNGKKEETRMKEQD